MATYIDEPSHTFNEYLLIPGYSSAEAIPETTCSPFPQSNCIVSCSRNSPTPLRKIVLR